MNIDSLDEFLDSNETLRIYKHNELIFSSKRHKILPLLDYLDYIEHYASPLHDVTMFDRVVGNAAALLAIKAHCSEIYSPLGSQLAIETLDKYGIRYHLTQAIPYILKENGKGLCPMEELSINKDPDRFYLIIKEFINKPSLCHG